MEALLDRAERAERHLLLLSQNHFLSSEPYAHPEEVSPGPGPGLDRGPGPGLDRGSVDGISRDLQGPSGIRVQINLLTSALQELQASLRPPFCLHVCLPEVLQRLRFLRTRTAASEPSLQVPPSL